MKKLLPVILMVFGVFLGSAGESFALPECPGGPTIFWDVSRTWTDCFGTYTNGGRNKYIGEFKDGKFHGQGIYRLSDGKILYEGIFMKESLKTAN